MRTRAVYRVLLRLHPRAFRERFAGEMLWVFDQSPTGFADTVRDGAVSVLTQWMADEPVPRVAVPFGMMPSSQLPAMRVAQATTVAALVTLLFFKALTQSVPLPQPPKNFEVRRAAWALCHIYSNPLERYPGGAPDCRSLQ